MQSKEAFLQNGSTVKIVAAVTPPAAVNILPTAMCATPAYNQFRVVNAGTTTVFLGAGITAAVAASNAAVVSTTGNAIPIVGGSVEVFSFPSNWFFTAGVASGTADIFITPGSGL